MGGKDIRRRSGGGGMVKMRSGLGKYIRKVVRNGGGRVRMRLGLGKEGYWEKRWGWENGEDEVRT